jgi:hypothetical protein
MRYAFVILFLFNVLILTKSQTTDDIYEWASEIIESLAEDSEDGDYSYMIEDLVRLSQDPININTANRDDLGKIFFLTDIQIENLLFHRYKNGSFYSVFELQAVEGFDRRLIEMIQPLIFIGEVSFKPAKHNFRGDLFLRTKFTVETPKGFIDSVDKPAQYQGDKLLYYTRFEASPARNLSVGLVAKTDPGEPMFTRDVSTFDYVSGYISWKPDKILKQIIIGQYKISGGQGLVLQSGMRVSKTSNVTSIRNRNSGFRTGLSTNEATGLSGLLLSFGNQHFSVTPFLSVQQRDGRMALDSANNIYLTTIRTDGYHRTNSELETRHNIREDIFGVQLRYFTKLFTFEAGHVEYHLQYPLYQNITYYNQYYFRGKQNGNTWAAIEGGFKKVFIFSEIAFNESLKPAVMAGLLASPAGRFNWVLSYRNIPLDFHAPLGNPFAESPNGSGESGFYSGIDLELPYRISVAAYIDYFKFKWLRYQIKAPTDGYDASIILSYKPNRNWETKLRYRNKQKGVNITSEDMTFPVGIREQSQWRFQSVFTPVSSWSFTTRLDWNIIKIPGKNLPNGFYIAQDIRYQHPKDKWYVIIRYGLVDAEDYENRFYIYEPDVLYAFNVPLYYGQGHRIITMLKYTVVPKLDIWVRYGMWHYYNRLTIGSGNNLIDSNISNEFRIQLRKRF